MRGRGIALLAVAALLAWGAVRATAHHGHTAAERPEHLLNDARRPIQKITVTDNASGRTVVVDGDRLRQAPWATVASDFSPLLAVRSLPAVLPEYGLDPPRADVAVETAAGAEPTVHVGATNFDRTGYYVTIDGRPGAALVLMRIGDAVSGLLSPQTAP